MFGIWHRAYIAFAVVAAVLPAAVGFFFSFEIIIVWRLALESSKSSLRKIILSGTVFLFGLFSILCDTGLLEKYIAQGVALAFSAV